MQVRHGRFGAFFHAKRCQTQRGNGWFHAGDGWHVRFHANVVRLRRTAADAHATARAVDVAKVGRTTGHGQVQIRTVEQTCRLASLFIEPAVDDVQNALLNLRGLEHTAVEQNGRRVQEGGARLLIAFQTGNVVQRVDLAAQEGRQMACDGGVLRIGQAQLRQTCAGAGLGLVADGHLGEEAFDQHGQHFVARDFGADAATNQLAATAGHDHGHGLQAGVSQQLFLGRAAAMCQRAGLPGVQLFAFGGQLARHAIGQRQVHVVAAEQNVLAHGNALQLEVAIALQHGDQREVGRTTAHVHHQDDVAMLDLLAPCAVAGLNPTVQRCLGLFQQCQLLEARRAAGLGRQLACSRVKRCGNGDGDVLLVKRRFRVGLFPGPAQVLQIANRRGQRRDATDFRGRIGWQQGAAAVHAGVAQPALGAADQANGRGRTTAAREFTHDKVLLHLAGQRAFSLGQLALVRQVQKRWQQRQNLCAGRRGELGNLQHLLHDLFTVAGGLVHKGQGAVGGTQVNTNAEFRAILAFSARRYGAGSYRIFSKRGFLARLGNGCKHAHGLQLHFCLGNDLGGLCVRQLGQLHIGDLPAAMAQRAGKGRLPHHIACQAHGSSVKACLQRNARAFGFCAHGRDGEMLAQHLAAAFVHHTCSSADFGIGVGGYVFLDEVHKACFALHQAQQLQGCGLRGHFHGFFHDLFDRNLYALFHGFLDDFFHGYFHADFDDLLNRHFDTHFLRRHISRQGFACAQAGDVSRQTAIAQDGKKTTDRNGDAAKE